MASWRCSGRRIAHEDHARRAVQAALGVRRAWTRYREELEREGGIRSESASGLNTGLVVVGSIGSDLRMDYTRVGDTTNVAARLLQAAEPGQIVVSEPLHHLVKGFFHTRSLGGRPSKGSPKPSRRGTSSPLRRRGADSTSRPSGG